MKSGVGQGGMNPLLHEEPHNPPGLLSSTRTSHVNARFHVHAQNRRVASTGLLRWVGMPVRYTHLLLRSGSA
jgi:hypothetical protein